MKVLGFLANFYLSHRKGWVRIAAAPGGGARVELAATANKNRAGLERLLAGLARELAGRPSGGSEVEALANPFRCDTIAYLGGSVLYLCAWVFGRPVAGRLAMPAHPLPPLALAAHTFHLLCAGWPPTVGFDHGPFRTFRVAGLLRLDPGWSKTW